MDDPFSARTGSFFSGGAFLRRKLDVVAYSAAGYTRYGVTTDDRPDCAGLFPAPPPCYASGYCRIRKKSDHAGGVMQ